LESAQRNYAASGGISGCKVELVLAYPSGWDVYIHKRVAMIGARVLKGAFAKQNLTNMKFDIEDVYTVSENLHGIQEWLRTTVAESDLNIGLSVEVGAQLSNLDTIKVSEE